MWYDYRSSSKNTAQYRLDSVVQNIQFIDSTSLDDQKRFTFQMNVFVFMFFMHNRKLITFYVKIIYFVQAKRHRQYLVKYLYFGNSDWFYWI